MPGMILPCSWPVLFCPHVKGDRGVFQQFATVIRSAAAIVVFSFVTGMGAARADIVISSKATANMTCSQGSCAPTAINAVFNVTDLENYVAQFGHVFAWTTGQNVEATNIVVKSSFAQPGSTELLLNAIGAIAVDAPFSVGTGSELNLGDGDLQNLSFGPKGSITFASTMDNFAINDGSFQLVGSLPDLASKANANPGGFYALANSYDASADGTYKAPPVTTIFTGYFEGLGNTMSNLNVKVASSFYPYVGLFADVAASEGFGVVRNLRLVNAIVQGNSASNVGGIVGWLEHGALLAQSSTTGEVKSGDDALTGGLVGNAGGGITSSWSSAKVTAGIGSDVGGLAGDADGGVKDCYATGTVTGGVQSFAGGLVALNETGISYSFATGTVRSGGGSSAGGLIGVNSAGIQEIYAEGNVFDTGGGGQSNLGGLIGDNESSVSDGYSTGAVTGVDSDVIGGVVGSDNGDFTDTYWDTTTSGLSQGAGNIDNDPGLTGLTNRQLKSGLPTGFASTIWKEKRTVNRGFPYLIRNPPPK